MRDTEKATDTDNGNSEGIDENDEYGSTKVGVIAGVDIFEQDMYAVQRLRGRKSWLNDNVINSYLAILHYESERYKSSQCLIGLPSIYNLASFFYTVLIGSGVDAARYYSRNERFVRGYDYAFIPVNLRQHWALGVVDFGARLVCYYDSLLNDHPEFLNRMVDYLTKEERDEGDETIHPPWTTMTPKDIPTQGDNQSECGVFVLFYAEEIARRRNVTESTLDCGEGTVSMRCKINETIMSFIAGERRNRERCNKSD
jgi:Ulp1 family protease